MDGEYENVIKNVSMFDAFTSSTTTFTNQVAVVGGHSSGITWQTWIAYPIVLLLLIIAVLIIVRQNLDRGAALLAQAQQCLQPILNLFKRNTGGAEEDIEMADMNPASSSDVQLHGRNLSDSERIRAGARSVSV